MIMKRILFSLIALLGLMPLAFGQVEDPVSWSHKAEGTSVTFHAKIDSPWHMYDLGPYTDGPNATTFTYKLPAGVTLDGRVKPLTKATRELDKGFNMEVGWYAKAASFRQIFKNTTGKPATVTANVEWQVCKDGACLPPSDWDFTFTVAPSVEATTTVDDKTAAVTVTLPAVDPMADTPATVDSTGSMVNDSMEVTPAADAEKVSTEVNDSVLKTEQKSLWATIIEAIIWGFAALLTPCVFPMVPMTVSFFMKGNGSRARGRFLAALYGFSIIVLYTLPIAVLIGISILSGGEAVTADIFNWLATHWVPNILFFIIFVIFAVSFFGAFEINMPSKLVGKTDTQADKGGLIGVFFMAMTLVLVSFSCTGPIVGTILVKSTQGEIWEPIITMLAFSTAFALPFMIFAFFPSLLKNLPKSGGWLNSVKVVLGFIELALGLKFLSVADMTYHWGLLDREVYLALWIVIFTLLGFYLLGKIKFAHDSDTPRLSVKRLFFAIATFSFVVYMIPGMWGAPLKALSGYLPPMSTMDFTVATETSKSYLELDKIKNGKPKYSDILHMPRGFYGFFDYKEGIEYAKAVGKPVMLDFTGNSCTNCREMEANVWTDPDVRDIIRNDYVLIAISVDDKTELPESEWVTNKRGKVLTSIGKINAAWQIERFNVNAQPYYCLIDPVTGDLLVAPRAYNLEVAGFVKFLESGLAKYKTVKVQ